MLPDFLRLQLLATRASIEVLLSADGEAETDPAECDHPPAKRHPVPTPGHLDAFLCKACHQVIEED